MMTIDFNISEKGKIIKKEVTLEDKDALLITALNNLTKAIESLRFK